MRITGITSRIISYDVSAIYGDKGPPQEISAEYRYSFDTFHTDEGIDGRSMQFGWMGEASARVRYIYERNSIANWQTESMLPYMIAATNSLFLASINPNYNAQYLLLSLALKW